jgi:glucose-1-phosphate thymidylyltransferase
MKGLVLSGGQGTRLRPITNTGPKQLVPVNNEPVLMYAIEDLREAGIDEIGVVLGNKGREEIQALLGDGSEHGVNITYIVQGDALGIAHAVSCAREFVGDDYFVTYLGDNILKQGITELVHSFQAGDYAASIALQSVDNPGQFGIVELDDGKVCGLVEKPDNPPTDLALVGVWVFSPAVFDAIERLEPSWRGELEITDAIQLMMEDGHAINSHVVDGWWKDTGKPGDVLEANRLLLVENDGSLDGTVAEGASVGSRVDLHETAIVESGAVVRSPASIDAGTVIQEGTYVGPYTSIGPNCTVENVHIENSIVVRDARISADKTIVDSLIGTGARIEDASDRLPSGTRLVLGENSNVEI